jgi:two-component system alkaline phosphatase synthesis response regulator PhoP
MKKKILIVEDHEDLIKFMEMFFKDSYETLSVKHGEEAVGLAMTEVPDLIIIDLVEYEVDSLEAIPLIRQNPKTRSIPIIAITEGLHDIIEHGGSSVDFDDYIAKPFLDEDLFPCIEKLLKQSSTQPN